jgi:hypothetical protein
MTLGQEQPVVAGVFHQPAAGLDGLGLFDSAVAGSIPVSVREFW